MRAANVRYGHEGRARFEGSGLGETSFADVKTAKLGVQRPVAALAKR